MFGDLRALLARKDNQQRWRLDASALLFESYALDPQRHREQWVPYLTTDSHRWARPLLTLSQVEELERWRAIAPFARFEFEFDPARGRLGPAYIDALHERGGLAQVHELRLERAHMACAHIPMLLRLPGIEDLRHLSLSENTVGDAGALSLAHCARLNALKGLILYANALGGEGARALFHSPWLAQVRYLSLSANPLGRSGALDFQDEGVAMRPLRLLLNGCALGDAHAIELARARCLGELCVLSLKWNPIGVAGRAALAGSPFLTEQVKRACLG